MAFKLPNQADLTIEQTEIINLPTNKNFVIQGGPGTGKTVMAIYRAGQMPRNARVLVLVYNQPLCKFIKTGIKNSDFGAVEVNTLHSWASGFFSNVLGENVPRNSTDRADYNWNGVQERLSSLGRKFYSHIIIDESQDCPTSLLEGLAAISEHITCFIDPNQKVVSADNADIMQTLTTLCEPAPYTLTRNFRNTIPIRDASVLFWDPTAGTPEPAKATNNGNKPKMIQCAKKRGDFDFRDQTKKMVEAIKNNLDKEIGVLVNAKSLKVVKNELKEALDADPYVAMYRTRNDFFVQMYKAKTKNKIDFSLPGIKILSHGTMKGLEFDMLLLPGLNYANKPEVTKALNSNEPDAVQKARSLCRNRLYVGLSRPISELYIYYFGEFAEMAPWQKPIVKPIFDHPELFEWKSDGTDGKGKSLFANW